MCFKKIISKEQRGSAIIEAAVVLPIIILTAISLITVSIDLYQESVDIIEFDVNLMEEFDNTEKEVEKIRKLGIVRV